MVMTPAEGRQLSVTDAVKAFQTMPAELQLASLHPELVEIDAKRDALLQPVYWCFRVDDQVLLHSFQLGDNPGLAIRDIQSAYGYGGPLSNTDDPGFLRMADDAFKLWARDQSVVAEFLRLHPLMAQSKWYSGEVVNNRETVYIDLTKNLFEQYENRRRTDIRRFLESGLSAERVSPQAMQRVFPALYRENMERIGAADDYYFPESYFDALFGVKGADNWLVSSEGQAVAGAVILASAPARVAEYHLGATAPGFERQKTASGLLHAVAGYYQSIGYRYFYLGGGRSVAADDGLLFFKKGFSPLTGQFQIGSRVYEREQYGTLQKLFPDNASSGRVLFYKERGASVGQAARR